MNTLNWDDINATIFERLDTALPEFEFTAYGTGWKSTNTTKLDGREGSTVGQVQCNRPGLLTDHSDGTYLQYFNYIQQRDSLDKAQTTAAILKLAGIEIELTPEQIKQAQLDAKAAHIWELYIEYTRQPLDKDNTDLKEMTAYLKARKYTQADVQAMQLGIMTGNWPQATEYIQSKSQYTKDDINEVIQCNRSAIGHSHKLIIPIRSRTGKAEGIAARNINWTPEDKHGKYLYNKGIKKSASIHGLPYRTKNGRAVIVEGQLDAAITQARGYDAASVGALGGKDISHQQVQCLLRSNTSEVTICLDNEPATIPQIHKAIALIQHLDEGKQIADRIYIAQLPKAKDVDELITQHEDGLQMFAEAVEKAQQWHIWQAEQLIKEHEKHPLPRTDKQINNLTEGIVKIAGKLDSHILKNELPKMYQYLAEQAGIRITAEALADAVLQIRDRENEKTQAKDWDKLLRKANDLLQNEGPGASIKYIKDNQRNIEMRSLRAEHENRYNEIVTEETMLEHYRNQPEGAPLGYSMTFDNNNAEQLEAPAGQLTYIAAPVNQGKTKMALNIAWNILQDPARSVHYFTYEINAHNVRQFALNIYLGQNISANNRSSIKTYFKKNTTQYVTDKTIFEEKKNKFFTEYITPGRLKIYYVEDSADELINFIEYIKRHDNNAVIFIDYIQKLRSDRKGSITNRAEELTFIAQDLNDCAIRTQLPIIAAAQFSRQVKSPLEMAITMLADSSEIEKTASEIYGCWDCNWPPQGNYDEKHLNAIQHKYGVRCGNREGNIIFQLLKSRDYQPGHFQILGHDSNSGRITQEQQINHIQPKPKPLPKGLTI